METGEEELALEIASLFCGPWATLYEEHFIS